jgi:hypothetical protein
MSDSSVRDGAVGAVDEEAAGALREILTDPALPVAALVSGLPLAEGVHISALREALDYVTSRRIATGSTGSLPQPPAGGSCVLRRRPYTPTNSTAWIPFLANSRADRFRMRR